MNKIICINNILDNSIIKNINQVLIIIENIYYYLKPSSKCLSYLRF